MAYRIPTFNLTVNIWHNGFLPPVGGPALSPMANLSPGRRRMLPTMGARQQPMELLLPSRTDIRLNDVVECPAGTARYYIVQFVDDVARGFANEYRFAQICQTGTWPVPIP